MAKKKNNTARKAVSDITRAKPEGFDAKADAGDFKKARAGPTGSADGKVKSNAHKGKVVSEAQEMFNAAPANKLLRLSRVLGCSIEDLLEVED